MARKILAMSMAIVVGLCLFLVPSSAATTLRLSARSAVMGIGEVTQFSARTNSRNAVSWVSSNKTVVDVNSNGRATALKEGRATITVSVDGFSAQIRVEVKKPPTSIRASNISVREGASDRINVQFPPGTASRARTFTSSNTRVARVDSNGNVRGVNAGTARIRVSAYNGVNTTVTVTVTAAPAPVIGFVKQEELEDEFDFSNDPDLVIIVDEDIEPEEMPVEMIEP
ncbi:MAG: Ig-like domain-containing protein [Oscillospiraceae bacterium]|nr:Ig-like domain-containing protein [Oscillospiraceae bacterium]